MNHIYITPDDRLQKVFDGAAPGSVIHLAPGVYRQKTVIRTPNLTILGAGAGKTRIVFDDYARKRDSEGFEYITFRSYTMAVCSDGVRMQGLSIINDAGEPEVKGQQVALSVCGTDFFMKDCTLTSTQDTLFLGPLPPDLIERYDGFLPDELRRGGEMIQLFEDCLIEGTVDFIFGCGNARFERCQIRSVKDARNLGYVAAPAHSFAQKNGFHFIRCDLICADGVADGSIYLARPWRDHGLVRFDHCNYGSHIAAVGFDQWNGTTRNLTARFYETPSVDGRVSWCNRANQL
jgi:pectinesterase